ncbi:MAG: hypothetical protein KDE24_03410, partial [Caldilinea sp.]|nr:hypothetical protein [Caldilinea sp.]
SETPATNPAMKAINMRMMTMASRVTVNLLVKLVDARLASYVESGCEKRARSFRLLKELCDGC